MESNADPKAPSPPSPPPPPPKAAAAADTGAGVVQTAQVAKSPPLVVADVPLSTTKALLLAVVFPRVHHVYVPPPAPTPDDTDGEVGRGEQQTDENESLGDSNSGKKTSEKVVVVSVDAGDISKGKARGRGRNKQKPVVIVESKDKDEMKNPDEDSSAGTDKNAEKSKKEAQAPAEAKPSESTAPIDNDDTETNKDNRMDDDDDHEEIGYVEGDDEKGEEAVEHVVTAEEMATVVKLPSAAEVVAAEPIDAKKMATEATKKIKTFFGIVNADEGEKATIHLTRAEAVDALKHENEVADETPNTAIMVEELLRICFKDLIAEHHLFNAPIYTDIKTTHDDDEEMWCELSVMVRTASIGAVLERLERIGVGSSVGTLSIYKAELCRTAYHYSKQPDGERDSTVSASEGKRMGGTDPKSRKSERKNAAVAGDKSNIEAARAEWKNAASRLRVEQVKEQIQESSELSLDFLALLIIASILAGIGLITNSTVVIVASMLVSPIMGPVMGMTFGARVNDWALAKSSFFNEAVSLLISVGIGGGIGFTASWSEGAEDWPTEEMISRGDVTGLITGICIAIPSGMGVALSILGNNTASLVGVAISASLLPPAVNAGICWAHGILIRTGAVSNTTDYIFGQIGGISFALTVVNIICIWLSGMIMFAIKEVAPTKAKSAFWSRDIKVARAQKQDSKNEVDVEVIRKGLSDALEKERQKEQKEKKRAPNASRRRRKRLIRKASGPRPEVTFNLAVNPIPIDNLSQMNSHHAKAIGLEPLVEPFPVAKGSAEENGPVVADAGAQQFGAYAYGIEETPPRPMLVDDVQYVGLEDMAALLGFDEDDEEEDVAQQSNQTFWGGLTSWFPTGR